MRVVLTKKMVVGHVMRYPGEVVDLPDGAQVSGVRDPESVDVALAPDAAAWTVTETAIVPELESPAAEPTPRRKGRKQA
jgi:hypothetical protein